MNKKLLDDTTLRDDLNIELMFMAGSMAFYGIPIDDTRRVLNEQLNLLVPLVKRYMKRSVRAYKDDLAAKTTPTLTKSGDKADE